MRYSYEYKMKYTEKEGGLKLPQVLKILCTKGGSIVAVGIPEKLKMSTENSG